MMTADEIRGKFAGLRFGYVYAPDSPQRDAWLAAHKMTGELMTDADTEYYNDKDRWVLVVEFTARDAEDYGEDDAPYPHRLARVVMKDWEHDDEASTLERGIGFDGDLRWEVTDDTCFTAYSDIIDALSDVITTALMNTVPRKLTLERRE